MPPKGSLVLDTSALLALRGDEPGADRTAKMPTCEHGAIVTAASGPRFTTAVLQNVGNNGQAEGPTRSISRVS